MKKLLIICLIGVAALSCKKSDETTPTPEEIIPGSGIHNGGNSLKVYTIKVGLDPHNSIYPTCIDIKNGLAYTLSSAATQSTAIDIIVFRYYSANLSFYAPSALDETKAWDRRKGTQIGDPDRLPVVDKISWDKITTNEALDGFINTKYYDYNDFLSEGSVVPLKTFEGLKALVRISKIVGVKSDSNSYSELEIKVYQ